MSRKLLVMVVLVALGYWGYSAWQSSVENRAQESKAKERAAQIKEKISSVAKKHDAVVDWSSRLAQGERFRMSPILTTELQDLWVTGRPILFIGSISDIARTSTDSMSLFIAYGALDQAHMFLGTDLRIRIQCNRALSEPLLAAARDPSRMALNSDIAVVAVISSIESSTERDSEGNTPRIHTGIGQCIDVVQIPELVLWWSAESKQK